MSIIIKDIKEINKIEFINGIGIKEIERRSRKIKDNKSDENTWRMRSFDGFLGENEGFKARLLKDYQMLIDFNHQTNIDNASTSSNINHKDIANYLKDIIEQCEKIRLDNNYGPMTPITMEYKTPKHLLQSIYPNQPLLEITTTLYITKSFFNGHQYSLFYNENYDHKSVIQKFKDIIHHDDLHHRIPWNNKWNFEYEIKSLSPISSSINNQTFKIGGGPDCGSIQFIETLGFYQGDEINPYRIDPIQFILFLSNK